MTNFLKIIKSMIPKKFRTLIIVKIRVTKVWLQNLVLLPLVILVFILRPFIIIRFGVIDASRISYIANTAGYLYLRDSEYKMHRYFDVIGCSGSVSNQHLMTMFARSMTIYPAEGFLYCLINACEYWLRDNIHQINFCIENFRFIINSNLQHLNFNDNEIIQGQKILEKLGIPNNARLVCLHNRDSKYLDITYPGHDWKYHDYRDFSVQSMKSAAEELASRGYYVLRMGSISAEPLTSNNPKIIDYTNLKERNDFADIFLLANCHFYLGSDSGLPP